MPAIRYIKSHRFAPSPRTVTRRLTGESDYIVGHARTQDWVMWVVAVWMGGRFSTIVSMHRWSEIGTWSETRRIGANMSFGAV